MAVSLIPCPNCGAPLSRDAAARAHGELWPCMFCNALLRINTDAAIAPTVESKVPDEMMARLRQLVLEGKAAEARAACAEAGLPAELVDQLTTQITTGVLFGQRMSPVGLLFLLAAIGALVGGIVLVRAGHGAGWALVVFGILFPLPLVKSIATTVKMSGSPGGLATIQRATRIGTRQNIEIFAFEVAVVPEDTSAPFTGTVFVPVRATSVQKAVAGTRMHVRYAKTDRNWLRFDRMA